MDAKKQVASGYGEQDIEAKAMTEAADPADQHPEVPAAPPADSLVQAKGTTEEDIAANIKEKSARASKR